MPTMRPHLYVTQTKSAGLRSIEDVRGVATHPWGRELYARVRQIADAGLTAKPITPRDDLPGRWPGQAEKGNRDHGVCHAARNRILACAMLHLLTDRLDYRDAALRQIECLYDPRIWKEWRDDAHPQNPADLRTGTLMNTVAIAYDWMHRSLTPAQRGSIIGGLDQCGIQPYLASVAAKAWWLQPHNNWHLIVVGGAGIAGMALAEDHPRSKELLDIALEPMTRYLNQIGPEGESNESPGYAGAIVHSVEFFAALRYHQPDAPDRLKNWPFPQALQWIMTTTAPPGFYVPIGDGKVGGRVQAASFAAIADACRDAAMQGFYLHHAPLDDSDTNAVLQLLWFDPTLEPGSPEGRLPRGRAYSAHSGCIVSRATWDYVSTPSLVVSKGGHGNEGHGHHDAGEVCIDGYGERLIVDPGVYPYPADFFGPHRNEYYFASSRGHNLVTIGGREMRGRASDRATLTGSAFDDLLGGWWRLDLSAMHDGVKRMTRTVVHLLPHVVAVLDEVDLEATELMTLRWHTIDRAEPGVDGRFVVRAGGASLAGMIARVDPGPISLVRGEHEHRPPYHMSRTGAPLEQRRECYIDALVTDRRAGLISLFCVTPPGEATPRWETIAPGAWRVETTGENARVELSAELLRVEAADVGRGWRVALDG